MPTLDDLVIPTNTTLPPSFYSTQFGTTPIHVQLNNTPTPLPTPKSPSPTTTTEPESLLGLFQDLHDDHSLETNHDLMYEMLYLAAENVPGWSIIPFEVLIQMIEVKQLVGGFSNFLVSFELKEEYLTNTELHSTRPTTLVNIINKITQQPTYDAVLSSFTFIKPAVGKVAVRIYGTAEFADREVELALAKTTSDQGISEVVYASWRHGRIASFLDGLSLGPIKWFDPILSGSLGYLQGVLHSNKFLSCFENTTLKVPALDQPWTYHTLADWCHKSTKTSLYKSTLEKIKANDNKRRISSVFDMFTNAQNSLYVVNRPACAVKSPVRCNNLILPFPAELESIIMPLLGAYQIDANPGEQSEFPFPYRSQRTTTLEDMSCVQTGLLNLIEGGDNDITSPVEGEIAQSKTILHPITGNPITLSNHTVPTPASRLLTNEESELVLEYLDLPRMKDEIQWLLNHCTLFPIVTSHNDYHAGNVLLLNNIVQTSAKDESGLETAIASQEGSATTTASSSSPTQLPNHAFTYPNPALPWIKVIDWEYGGFNYRGYDCANSSNESWIAYVGGHPGFTLDIPAWVSTAYLGKYDPTVLQIDSAQSESLKDLKYEPFPHHAIEKMYDQAQMDQIVKIWAQREDKRLGQDIQHILLGDFATKPFVNGASGAPGPTYRPRELTWAQACLTGYYHAITKKHFETCPDPTNTPIYPFETTTPPQSGFNANYVLPATLEEWLEDQVPKLLFETQILQLASMLAWSFWGITFTDGVMTEGFGYLEHALARMIAYVAKKEVMIKMDLLNAPHQKKD